jgi:hypothetical protein
MFVWLFVRVIVRTEQIPENPEEPVDEERDAMDEQLNEGKSH